MIKLNNKNITYVALADTNNSIKAPKEIWYADSNNSVKLVYRRKDALIEGEDYEKCHWVKGDGSAYIDTLINPSFGDELNATFTFSSKPTIKNISLLVANDNVSVVGFITGGDFPRSGYPQLLIVNRPVATSGYIEWGSKSMGTTIKDEYYIYMKINNAQMPDTVVKVDGVICNYDSIVGDNSISEVPITTYKVGKGYKEQTGLDTVKLRNITISSKINLIPCKLLKPVPKWLDANGIRRQVGECGMIDLVSGKFYGNVNNVGTFTVENYYERKEWLKGDGTAYIDTDIIVDVPSLYISTSFTKKVGGQTPLFGSRNYITSNGSQVWYFQSGQLRLDIITNGTNWITVGSNNVQNINQLIIDCPNNIVSINEVIVPSEVDDLSIKNSIYTFKIFSLEVLGQDASTNNKPYHGAFGNFILNDSTHSLNLIPCTLTMDLPASMDANNISRTKGTSGMWDLVSDRFYGNVANSGTFKAVNLAEGVDYEVHQWLVGEIPIHISMQSLPINSANFSFTAIFGQKANITILKGETHEYYVFDDNMQKIRVWGYNGIGNIYEGDVLSNTMIVESTSAELLVNNITIPQYSYPIKYFTFYSSNNSPNNSTLRVSKIYVDGIERYIPVKLLKSIPSKYDANGIARQAGECGMYDTVNDVFYGNVASSGSFTVEDDN